MSETQYDAFNVQNVLDGREAIFDGRGKPIDYVNHPPHYTAGKVECIDAIESATVGKTGIEAVLVGAIVKYLWRYEAKGGIQDVQKAEFYLKRLIAQLKETQ